MTASTPDTITKRLTERSEGAHLEEDGIIYAEEIRFCWIDEDGARVSPVHKDFGKAISWISDWPSHMARTTEKLEKARAEMSQHPPDSGWYRSAERDATKAQEILDRLTRTGKPPVRLRRLVMRTTVESIESHENETVERVVEGLTL